MLAFKLSHILNARGIDNHFTFLLKSGFTRHTASNLLHSETHIFRLDHIEALCRIRVCEPQDLIITYYPSSKYPLPDNHPLNNLIKNEDHGKTIKNSLRYLPYKELMSISHKIAEETSKQKDASE